MEPQSDNLLKTALDEIERLLTTRTVVGEPIKVGEATIIPLFGVGFGFGGGAGGGEDAKSAGAAKGQGSGAAGGGGIRPVAVIVVDKDGQARVEPVRTSTSIIDKVGDAVARTVNATRTEKTVPA
jgi:uncharacterized spore protein YtfJ